MKTRSQSRIRQTVTVPENIPSVIQGDFRNSVTVSKTLFDLPAVVQAEILKYLSVRDLVDFRLVCKDACSWVKNFPGLKSCLRDQEIMFEDSKEMAEFNKLATLPFTSFSIDFNVLSTKAVRPFIKKFANSIETLVVSDMDCCFQDSEFNFFQSLTSLQRLKVSGKSWEVKNVYGIDGNKTNPRKTRIPLNCLQNLTELVIQDFGCSNYHKELLYSSPNLKRIALVAVECEYKEYIEADEIVTSLVRYLKARKDKTQPLELDFMTFDGQTVEFLKDTTETQSLMTEFVRLVGSSSVTLKNIGSTILTWLDRNKDQFTVEETNAFLNSIYSIDGLKPEIRYFQLPSLQSISFSNIRWERGGDYYEGWDIPKENSDFPKLKSMDISLDIDQRYFTVAELESMFKYLFHQPRPSVTDLRVVVSTNLNDEESDEEDDEQTRLIIPENLVSNFKSLVEITFGISYFRHADYSQLFQLLGEHTKIENLTWTVMKNYDNFTLPPTILGMKHLKTLKVEVRSSVTRSRWTDKEFIEIISKMPLDYFAFQPDEEEFSYTKDKVCCLLHQVTSKGIKSLTTGIFGKNHGAADLDGFGKCCLKKPSIQNALDLLD